MVLLASDDCLTSLNGKLGKAVMALSHGNADAERGFSTDEMMRKQLLDSGNWQRMKRRKKKKIIKKTGN